MTGWFSIAFRGLQKGNESGIEEDRVEHLIAGSLQWDPLRGRLIRLRKINLHRKRRAYFDNYTFLSMLSISAVVYREFLHLPPMFLSNTKTHSRNEPSTCKDSNHGNIL
jgi:hypothetical protein